MRELSRRGRRGEINNGDNLLFFGLRPPASVMRQLASIAHDHKNTFSLSGPLQLNDAACDAWTADELLLIHSILGKTEHRIIDRWPLLG